MGSQWSYNNFQRHLMPEPGTWGNGCTSFLSGYLSRQAMGPQLGAQLGPRGHNSFLSGYLSRKAMEPQLGPLGPQLGPQGHNSFLSGCLSRKAMGPSWGHWGHSWALGATTVFSVGTSPVKPWAKAAATGATAGATGPQQFFEWVPLP